MAEEEEDVLGGLLAGVRAIKGGGESGNGKSIGKALAAIGLSNPQGDGNKGRLYSDEEMSNMLQETYVNPDVHVRGDLLDSFQVHWHRPADLESMYAVATIPNPTKMVLDRRGLDGRVVGLRETSAQPHRTTVRLGDRSTARNDKTGAVTSITRSSASSAQAHNAAQFVRGKIGQTMFVPGGLEREIVEDESDEDDALEVDEESRQRDQLAKQVALIEREIGKGVGLSKRAPGLPRDYRKGGGPLRNVKEEDTTDDDGLMDDFVGLQLHDVRAGLKAGQLDEDEDAVQHVNGSGKASTAAIDQLDADVDELLPSQRPQESSRANRRQIEAKRDWAHVVDVNRKMVDFHKLVPEMAHKYPFELDDFQKEAVYHLEQGDSVFVAAHTSAGKTVVAEYAISLASKHMTRCIYTSPIKALSNQKFRDFKQTFGAENVGILTGDVQINPEAPCLIMTTEILRSMLYRGADLIRDVEFVIFDEVHYVNDLERGVVWEEVIILCPQHISLILLSATVPNTKEFADWVGRTKKKDIYVISTPKRPVPLEHYLYAAKDIYKIVDARGQFLGQGVKEAGEAIKRRQDKEREANGLPPIGAPAARGGRGGQRGSAVANRGRGAPQRGRGGGGGNFSGGGQSGRGDKSLWVHLVGLLKKRDLLPVVTFVFSKKRCEEYAGSLPNTDMCTAREKSEVHVVIERSLTRLKGSDRLLPQIARMRDLLSRGIGVHHGGLLPIVKEVVEILFQRGLVKVLFATETFAMGVNMPARSVVFSGIRKHDGHSFRELLAGEYTQMSGRAGRRGLDPTGVVIINAADQLPETEVLHKMLLGQATKLKSQFRLTYNMILNLLRVEALKVEEMIKRSFSENAAQRLLPDQQKKVKEIESYLASLPAMPSEERAELLDMYYDMSLSAQVANADVISLALGLAQGSKNFSPGRIVVLLDQHFAQFTPAVLVKQTANETFLCLAAVTEERKSGKLDSRFDKVPPQWPPTLQGYADDELVYDLREIPLSSIALLTEHELKIEQSMIMALRISAMQRTVAAMKPIISNMKGVDRVKEADWSKIRRIDFQEALQQRTSYDQQVRRFITGPGIGVIEQPTFNKEYAMIHQRKLLLVEIGKLKRALSDENLELLPDYHQRIDVLKRLRFIDGQHENVLLKGRVACEINSVDELVTTELILDNFWTAYEPEEVVGLLSCLVFREKADGEVELHGRLAEGYAKIVETAERISAVQAQSQLNTEDYERTLKTHMVPVAYAWARGTPFAEICEMTDIAEGTIVRVITRLDEACRELRDAARVIGDADLWTKMERCMELIRRDIVFAASLYF